MDFFIISERNTKICVGGKVKNINKIKNLNDLYACFQNVLVMYIRILAPYRTLQEKIAREIKEISKMGVNTWGIEVENPWLYNRCRLLSSHYG